ncbi:MAG: Gfo/Idh/MocA family oxidoreductase [Candidatus Omnitrophica bacterium]|nr:Myo-inositol 2-dehydrogenase [bacterium]NUN98535.1 Gfo/Idh/MocA family oxidoreductase [Candidatus Omnitrophota bacterium]
MAKEGVKTRRDFLKTAARASVAPMIVSAATLGRGGAVAANDRIGIGFIAFGDRVKGGLFPDFKQHPVCHFVAAADVDSAHRYNFIKAVGEERPTYNDYRELLERKDIDAVVIATPDHWHARAIIESANAGKDIYCEKPMTLTIEEGKRCVAAVRNNRRVFQTGSQQRSDSRFRKACELVRNGYIGKVELIETFIGGGPTGGTDVDIDPPPGLDWDRWLGQAPVVPYRKTRCHYEFRWWYAYSGGKMTDWGAHHNDIAQWGNGTDYSGPISAEGEATFPEPGGYDTALTFKIRYEYKDAAPVICNSEGRNGVIFTGSEGKVFVSRSEIETTPTELANIEFKDSDLRLYKSDNHQLNFLECVKTREDPICHVEVGHRSVTVCHLGNIAIRLGRKIQWDPEKEEIVGDPEAHDWMTRPQRHPYEVPEVKVRRSSRRPAAMNRRSFISRG